MKKTFRLVAFATLVITLAGCQKNSQPEQRMTTYATNEVYSVVYSVDGEFMTEVIHDDEEWIAFIDRMFTMAEEGRSVFFQNSKYASNTQSSKEKVVYTTYDRKDAESWADLMGKKGYSVQIDHNATTGEYTCTAIK